MGFAAAAATKIDLSSCLYILADNPTNLELQTSEPTISWI